MTSDNNVELRVRALESLLLEKGLVEAPAIDEIIDLFENRLGPQNGGKVVVRAWTDPAFKARLLANATEAIVEMGYDAVQGEDMVVVENTDEVHNMVVCTLCSCYPWEVLGLPPTWYKSAPYRARAVIDPKGVLADFGVTLPEDTNIRVWDSTAETRFIVLPLRPDGTEGWDQEKLAALVTRDSMVGTGLATSADEAAP